LEMASGYQLRVHQDIIDSEGVTCGIHLWGAVGTSLRRVASAMWISKC
jgi:hypothetical protein